MNRRVKIIVGVVIFIVLLVGADRLLKTQNRDRLESTNEEKSSIMDRNNTISNVMEVTSETFETEVLQSDKKVLIDFYAVWCGPCQVLSPIIDKVSIQHEEVKFVRIDVDKTEDIASEYGISSIPTLVLIENGKEINRSIGLISEEKVNDFLK